MRGLDHDARQQFVDRGPGSTNVGCEFLPQPLLECPEKRVADGRVVRRLDAVSGVPASKFFDNRYQTIEIVQAVDRQCEHFHQLAALFLQVTLEERPELGRGFEQATVKELRRLVRDRRHGCKGALHMLPDFRCHRFIPLCPHGTSCSLR